ncbi:MAG TPA: hypothetical protein H9820_05530 [Candidatus Companilactobacillus pullicola]|uniref:Uncharacterized protein n=2 Tax=Companilactobacillus TaxID=2767879 RepID=A0A386PW62_9LACO|nr:hypothetical protein [Companilactobacillus zhachilii]AYE38720.1 hypothetical protein D1B17_08785 [Companilactobacillus zhachilii]HIY92390.1 hypothetical protein [Candidatus Companilactobacillus pullicola]
MDENKYLKIIDVLTSSLKEATITINRLLDKKSSEIIMISKLDDILTVLKQIREDRKPLTRKDVLKAFNGDHSDSSK